MPNPLNAPITPPRVAFIDPRTGTVSREWYMFFLSLFQLVGGSSVSLVDLQKGPPTLTIDEINAAVSKASENLRPSTESTVEQIAELRKQIEALESQVRPELGTMSQIQQANVPWQTFDTTPQSLPTDIGTVAWDGGTTLGIQMTANVLQPVGEAQYFYIKADSTITKGQLIMFTGAVGASGVIKGAPATGLTDGQYLMGIAAEDIATNGFGLVTSFGNVRGWNTTGSPVGETWADGDILYYNPSIAGGLTKTQPTAPNVKATVAVVVNAAPAGSGDVFVRVSTGSVLGGTDSNVQITGLANNDVLVYDSVDGRWENYAPTAARDALGLGTGNPSNGQTLIGNGTDFTTAALTAGSGITITNGAGSITINAAVAALAAGANISITGTTTKTIAVTGLGTMAFENTGVSGSFTTADVPPKTVTVTNGIITSIV